jgi:hypothetical protein
MLLSSPVFWPSQAEPELVFRAIVQLLDQDFFAV